MTGRWEEEFLREEVCHFHKHADTVWWDVIQRDRSYVQWCLENLEDMDEELRDALSWGVTYAPDRIG